MEKQHASPPPSLSLCLSLCVSLSFSLSPFSPPLLMSNNEAAESSPGKPKISRMGRGGLTPGVNDGETSKSLQLKKLMLQCQNFNSLLLGLEVSRRVRHYLVRGFPNRKFISHRPKLHVQQRARTCFLAIVYCDHYAQIKLIDIQNSRAIA